jgi:hypothetical protein
MSFLLLAVWFRLRMLAGHRTKSCSSHASVNTPWPSASPEFIPIWLREARLTGMEMAQIEAGVLHPLDHSARAEILGPLPVSRGIDPGSGYAAPFA